MFTDLKPFLHWLHLHPHWAGIAVFLIAFIECLALVGLFLPGIVMMTAIGSLIGTGILPFTSITLWAIAGAFIGDILSFSLGYHYHQHIRDLWPFRNYPTLLQKGERYFLNHGRLGIFLGRFIGPIRPVLPLIAGMMSMPPLRFLFADILSAIVWAPVYLLPGILVGAASQELAPASSTHLILIIIGILLGLWCISWLIKRLFVSFINLFNHALAQLWKLFDIHPILKKIKMVLTDPLRPNSHSQLALTILLLIAFIIFVSLTISVALHGVLTTWNAPVYYFMRSLRTTDFDPIMVSITVISPGVMVVMWLAVLTWLIIRRYIWAASHWLAAGILAIGSGTLLRHVIHSARPNGLLQIPPGWSYPSGHTLMSVTLFGFLAVLLARNWQRDKRWLAYVIAGLLMLCVISSRLYLGGHWLTDVVGGALLGFIIATLCTLSYRRCITPTIAPISTLSIAFLALLISWSGNFIYHFKQTLHNYTPIWTIQTWNNHAWWSQNNTSKPLYRINRFGQPIEALNIQWAGTLPSIEQTLTKQHWNLLPKASLMIVLNGFASKHPHQQLPILNQFYEDHKPVLVMYKLLDQPKQVMVLRLWDAHLKLSNNTPLWLGIVNYHKPWRAHFFRHMKEAANSNTPEPSAPSDILTSDLQDWTWKKINYPALNSSVLLIK